ncbi:hypothetical protein [Bacillus wiedmannii]|uniref:hypothetical protein n=1 Tax=Bacillus wiedmannii TaxID=1890302 RepID=UPI001C00F2F1|nr:hypothetical protein [Bacillus wiedmannii]
MNVFKKLVSFIIYATLLFIVIYIIQDPFVKGITLVLGLIMMIVIPKVLEKGVNKYKS